MATAKASSVECPVCKVVYSVDSDPRVLPCGHTCCFTCIETLVGNRLPGQSLPCPCCRQEFILPRELPKNYQFMDILEMMNASGLVVNCDQHADRQIEIYCTDCKMAICTMCALKSHKEHTFSDSDDLREQMANDVENITSGIDKCRAILQSVDKEEKDFIDKLEITEDEVYMKAEQLKQMIDDLREKLVNKLQSVKQKRIKEIESLREEIVRQLSSMESYKKYVDEMRQEGTACDIARAASGLHDRADELLIFDAIECTLADLGHVDVTFTSSNYVINDVNKTLGRLRVSVSKTGDTQYSFTRLAQHCRPHYHNIVQAQYIILYYKITY